MTSIESNTVVIIPKYSCKKTEKQSKNEKLNLPLDNLELSYQVYQPALKASLFFPSDFQLSNVLAPFAWRHILDLLLNYTKIQLLH